MAVNDMFKALADPTRRQIIVLLRDEDLTAGQIADHFPISKPSVSRHLRLLRQAGLVLDERQGQSIVYSLNTTVLQDAVGWIFQATGMRRDTVMRRAHGAAANNTTSEASQAARKGASDD
ncbi:MAG: autorepressor SdpR family transcription factor [Bifidobacterium sp.]|jgi:DNA-binding transcriptional ArsR family regulator